VDALREKQAHNAVNAVRKRELSERFEAEFERVLGAKSEEAVLKHFGAANFKKLLVQYHPDRTPQGASFEETVRREVIFKWVQQKHENEHGTAGRPPPRPPAEAARAEAEARRWRAESAAKEAAAEAEAKSRSQAPPHAVLHLASADDMSGRSAAKKNLGLGPCGYYEVHPDGGHKGKPRYRKIVPSHGDFPWAAEMESRATEAAEQIYWTGACWGIGERPDLANGLYQYMGFGLVPPTSGWEQVDVRAPAAPTLHWL